MIETDFSHLPIMHQKLNISKTCINIWLETDSTEKYPLCLLILPFSYAISILFF